MLDFAIVIKKNLFRMKKNIFREISLIFFLYFFFVILFSLIITKNSSGPVHLYDEARYWDTAYNISKGTFNIQIDHHYPPLYPLIISPAFIFFHPSQTYSVVKWINVLSISSACFPIYMISRKFLSKKLSIIVSFIVFISPIYIVFPGSILSENLFFPLFFWALYFSFFNIFSKESKWIFLQEFLLGFTLAFLFLTRYIALALIPAFFSIWWLKTHKDSAKLFLLNKRMILRFLTILIPLIFTLGFWILLGLRANMSLFAIIGFGLTPNNEIQNLNLLSLLIWIALYLSYILLISSPAVMFYIFSVLNLKIMNWNKDYERWILSLFILLIFFLIPTVEHSWSAWYNNPIPSKIQGRYIFYFGPLFFISAFISISNLFIKDSVKKNRYIIFIVSVMAVVSSYLILFRSKDFLEKQISIAPSSPFGLLVSQLGPFLIVAIVFMLIFLMFAVFQKKEKIASYLIIFYLVEFVIGGSQIFQRRLVELQLYNFQAKNIAEVLYKEIQEKQIDKPWVINSVFNKHFDEKSKYYLNTLKFNGFLMGNTSFTPDDSDEILSIEFSGDKYYLFTKDYFDTSQKILKQFELQDDTYIISKITD